MKKRGFTLIELLAVIVILAIIALIATPIIMNIIDRSKGGVYDRQRDMVAKSAELYYFKYNDELVWEDDISYVEIGRLKETGYLREKILNPLNNQEIPDETKVLIYKEDGIVKYSLQLYDNDSFKWYQQKMVESVKSMNIELPTETGEKTTVDLNALIDQGKAAEIRIPTDITNRCVGYVEIEKTGNDNYAYEAYVDCLLDASTFASHYVSYGGKYLDVFNDIKQTSDGGYIAVGRSNSEIITKYGTGNNGKYDAIIVKFDSEGNVVWSKNFGGSNDDEYNSVIEFVNGYIAVGRTTSDDGDVTDHKGGIDDALIVSYDHNGNVLHKRSFGSSNRYEAFRDIMIENDKIIVSGYLNTTMDGDLEGLTPPNAAAYTAVNVVFGFDLEFIDINWYGGNSNDQFYKTKKIDNNKYISVGWTSSRTNHLDGIKCSSSSSIREAMILKHDIDGNVLDISVFCGNGSSYFRDVVKIDDGYIAVGYSVANDMDMEGLSKANNGYNDAIIVKYDEDLNIVWKKSFGGSEADIFNGIEKINNEEVVVIGYSKSKDMDMQGLSNSGDGYNSAIIAKYNTNNGDITKKSVFGGSNSEQFTGIIKTSGNQLFISGGSYSIDKDLKSFNKGHQDAIIVKYDNNLNLLKSLQEPVVIIDKLKQIIPNYGTEFSMSYDNIYTTNDATVDLRGWCTASVTITGNNNYDYGQCLKPFNADDMKLLNAIEKPENYKKIYAGEQEYTIDNAPDDPTNWYQIWFRPINSGSVTISNFKIKFEDGYIGSIRESIDNSYLEPLVVVSNIIYDSSATYPNPLNIIESGGILENSTYPVFYINLKSKQKKMVSYIFETNRDITGTAGGFTIHELRNFDMSINPTN
jgi:prepilin-type N-terminal cleavage/methylation domain-containing protein